jgi:hypothetical protein
VQWNYFDECHFIDTIMHMDSNGRKKRALLGLRKAYKTYKSKTITPKEDLKLIAYIDKLLQTL